LADWVSISINLALGLPVAAVVIVVARELSRALAAPAAVRFPIQNRA
jgi:hypothetical protein